MSISSGQEDFRKPPDPEEGIISSSHLRRSENSEASTQDESGHEQSPPVSNISFVASLPTVRRGWTGPITFRVEVVRFRKQPPNRENPHATLAPADRYECLMTCLAEIWSDICKHQHGVASGAVERKLAA